jgi:hypothetical protein
MSGVPRQIERGIAADPSRVRRWLKRALNRLMRRWRGDEPPPRRFKGWG